VAHNWELMHIYIYSQTKDRLTDVVPYDEMGVNHQNTV